MDKFSELEKLSELKDKWILTEEEFQKEKEKILYWEIQDKEVEAKLVSSKFHAPQIKEAYKDSMEFKTALLVKELFSKLGISDSLKYKMTIEDVENISVYIMENTDYKTFNAQFRKDVTRFSKLMIIGMLTLMRDDKVFNVRDFTGNLIKDIRHSKGENEYKDLEKTREIIHFVFPNYENLNDSEIYNNTPHTNPPIFPSYQKPIQEPLTPDSYMDKVIWHTIVASIIAIIIIDIMQELRIISTAQSAGGFVGTYIVYPLFMYFVYLASTLWQNNNKDWFYALIPVYGLVAPIYTPHKSIKTIIAIVITGLFSFSFYTRIPILISDLLK